MQNALRPSRACFLADSCEKSSSLHYGIFLEFLHRESPLSVFAPEFLFNPLTIKQMKSVNTFSLTGRLTADANFFESKNGRIARFSLAHNYGKGVPALFIDAVIFPKKGQSIPEDLLKKGTPVLISGYLRPNTNTKDGKTYTTTDFVVTTLLPAEVEGEGGE